MTATIGSAAVLVFVASVVLFPSWLPISINPLLASRKVLMIENVSIYVITGRLMEYRLQRFKDHVDAIRSYMAQSDLIKWWLTTLLTAGCIAATAWLIASSDPMEARPAALVSCLCLI